MFSRHLQYTYLCCRGRTLWTRPQMGVWTFDAWCHGVKSASEQLQLCELSGPTFRFTKQNLAWWAVTRWTSKNHKTVKIWGWVLVWVWALAWDNTVLSFQLSLNVNMYFHYSIVSCSCGKSRGKYTANLSTEEKAISSANMFFLKPPPPPTLLPSSSKKQISYHHAEAANRLHVYFNYRTPWSTLQPENWCNSYKTSCTTAGKIAPHKQFHMNSTTYLCPIKTMGGGSCSWENSTSVTSPTSLQWRRLTRVHIWDNDQQCNSLWAPTNSYIPPWGGGRFTHWCQAPMCKTVSSHEINSHEINSH